jgi:threonine 3-dehydrogenase
MRALITGAGGQVGLELIRFLQGRNVHVIPSDVAPKPKGCPEDVTWEHLDVTDPAEIRAVIERTKPAVIYHLAAILSARGEQIPHVTYEINQTGTRNLLEACRELGIKKFIFTSTIAAFGPGLPDPVPNEVSMRPTTMYGITKVSGELLGEYYRQKWGLDFRGVRFPGLINAGIPGGGTSDYALHMYTTGMKEGGYESFCHADTRIPLMYMPDAIRALVEVAEAPRDRLRRSIYNISAVSPTAGQIAESVAKAVPGVKLTFKSDPLRQAILDSWPNALDDSCARDEWDWEPHYDLDAMTADMVIEVRKMIESGLL